MKRLLVAALALASVCHAAESVSVPAAGGEKVTEIRQLWDSGEKKKALSAVKRWKKSEGKSPWPWIASAEISFEQEKYGRCISMAEGALKRDPHSADGFYWRGRGLEGKGKALEAANEYQAALEASPGHARAMESLTRVKAELGESSASVGTN